MSRSSSISENNVHLIWVIIRAWLINSFLHSFHYPSNIALCSSYHGRDDLKQIVSLLVS
eukprot:UN03660